MKTKPIIIICLILSSISFFLYNNFEKNEVNISDRKDIKNSIAEIAKIDPPVLIPELVFSDTKGKKVKISKFRGKVVIINFWAKWCKPCVKELPQLSALKEVLGEENIEIIAISIDANDNIQEIRSFYELNGIGNLEIYQDKNSSAYDLANASGIPTTYVLDQNLFAHYKISGYVDWSDFEVINLVQSLLL
jgi:thiol-disulfide isomerase/thioredoxin